VPICNFKRITDASGFKGLVNWTSGAEWRAWSRPDSLVCHAMAQHGSGVQKFGKIFSRQKDMAVQDMDAIETPTSWFIGGPIDFMGRSGVAGIQVVRDASVQSTLAVVLAFFLSLVACRVDGRDRHQRRWAPWANHPTHFGILNPGNRTLTLMSANITSAAAGSSADLLTDLKSGYLLGANPRKQLSPNSPASSPGPW